MQFPLDLRFKVIALASQMYVTDQSGAAVFYVKQKLFKLKEAIEIYRDGSKNELLFKLQADRVIDFSPVFRLSDPTGRELGSIKRHGGKSIWRAHFEIEIGGKPFASIREANVWSKVGNALFGEIPIAGFFAGYVFHPRYKVMSPAGDPLGELSKEPAFFEGKYLLAAEGISSTDEQTQTIFAALMMAVALLERSRG